MLQRAFAFLTEQGQAGARHGNTALFVEKVVFPVTQSALGRIIEGEVRIVFLVMAMTHDLDAVLLHRLRDGVALCDFDLDLGLERFLFRGAAQCDQLRQHGLLALDQEGIDLLRNIGGLREQFLLMQGKQLVIPHQPFPVDHDIAHIRGFAGVNDLGVGVIVYPPEGGRIMEGRDVNQDQVGAAAGSQ